MKVKKEYILRSIAGEHIVVPVGKEAVTFNGIMTLNRSGKLLFEALQNDIEESDLVNVLLEEYEVTEAVAKQDVQAFLAKLKDKDLLL